MVFLLNQYLNVLGKKENKMETRLIEKSRLQHAIDYLDHVENTKILNQYLAGEIELNNDKFHNLLNHFLDREDYEICQDLVNNRNDL